MKLLHELGNGKWPSLWTSKENGLLDEFIENDGLTERIPCDTKYPPKVEDNQTRFGWRSARNWTPMHVRLKGPHTNRAEQNRCLTTRYQRDRMTEYL